MTHLETVLTPFDFLSVELAKCRLILPPLKVFEKFGSGKKGAWGNYIVGKYKSTTTDLSSNTSHFLHHVLSLLSSHKSWLRIKIGHVLLTAIHGGISVTCLLTLIEKRISLNLTFYMNVTFGLSYINIQIIELFLMRSVILLA